MADLAKCRKQKRHPSFQAQKSVCLILNFNATNLLGLHMYTMVYYRVVSTKLTEEEHSRLLDVCNIVGCSSSELIRDAIIKIINLEQKTAEKEFNPVQILAKELNIKSQQAKKEFPNVELAKLLGMKE